MHITTLTVAWLLSLPALVIGQTPSPTPDPSLVHHDSVEVNDTAPGVQESSSPATAIKPAEVKDLPSRPATVNDTLPLLPGIVRLPSGGLQINGSGEQRRAMLVNQADITDLVTGGFGASARWTVFR